MRVCIPLRVVRAFGFAGPSTTRIGSCSFHRSLLNKVGNSEDETLVAPVESEPAKLGVVPGDIAIRAGVWLLPLGDCCRVAEASKDEAEMPG